MLMLSVDGDAEVARVCKGLNEIRQIVPLLTNNDQWCSQKEN